MLLSVFPMPNAYIHVDKALVRISVCKWLAYDSEVEIH